MNMKLAFNHDDVRTKATRLKGLLGQDVRPDVQQLASARWAFASALMQLLATKERYIYTKLELDERPEVNRYFDRSKKDLRRRFDAYIDHMQKWPSSDTINWSSYRKSAIDVVDLFLVRLTLEETELFKFIEKMEIDVSHPCMAISNWTRYAFQMKDNIAVM
ncbi:hypothetical protein [Sphingobium sp. SCG-1]|uniref:hypothetical protein n=1 Tax=Sphingobium sp. SCG-1 TaxID=2072936 RepID=UPI0011AB5D92|nr:hypothetical protein [Sphingobium sp. SCG-1]